MTHIGESHYFKLSVSKSLVETAISLLIEMIVGPEFNIA
jgi:hypothetical protein